MESLHKLLTLYRPLAKEEQAFHNAFVELLRHPRAFFRDHLPGHITGSAWIVDPQRQHVLLTHHAKLNRWLQPGGHADGDENIIGVALREAKEETGLTTLRLVQNSIFDIDVHTIPARNDFPEHLHYDVRFLFEADPGEKIIVTTESHALEWISMDNLDERCDHNPSMVRMKHKCLEVR
jgi:8-oxo-dGTP pyrophosphatase MutT (NUDIX family)